MAEGSVATTSDEDERRREPRQSLSGASVTLEGRDHAARDWSESGFLVGGYEGGLAAGDRTDIHMSVPSSGGKVAFTCQAIVVRVDAEAKTLAGAFARMDENTRVTLQGIFRKVEAGSNSADPV